MSEYIKMTKHFKVANIERCKNSRNGNPRFKFIFTNGFKMKTPIDAGWVYSITPHALIDEIVRVTFKTTSKGYEVLGLGI
mgnify:CR=1 FL=1|tara:strand:- start:319 stop:558 length:240 start_codon:yes stop_codon:yes gene_type:complete